MEELRVHVVKRQGAILPGYATSASSGMDLRAHVDQPITLGPLERALVPTGISLDIPEGFEGEVRPRSGLAISAGVTVLNAPGTIDADYRGEVKVILINLGNAPYEIRKGDRIAQIVFAKTVRVRWEEVDRLPETERGEGGFGSTGRE
jgi:dUTP pyrophosphatase